MMRGVCLGFLMALTLGSTAASAQNLTGYCVDNGEEGCQSRYIPFRGKSIDFCEETCTLTNPVVVRGLEATLYDFDCKSDMQSDYNGRVLLIRQKDYQGKLTITLLTKSQMLPIVQCR